MVLCKLSVPGRPTSLDIIRVRAYYDFSRCGLVLIVYFFSCLSFHFFLLPLWETVRYKLKYCLKRPRNTKQPTNKPTNQLKTNKRFRFECNVYTALPSASVSNLRSSLPQICHILLHTFILLTALKQMNITS